MKVYYLFLTEKTRTCQDFGGGKVEGVGVMKDKDLPFEEIEVSHTLRGSGEGHH